MSSEFVTPHFLNDILIHIVWLYFLENNCKPIAKAIFGWWKSAKAKLTCCIHNIRMCTCTRTGGILFGLVQMGLQPWRAVTFLGGFTVTMSMAIQVLRASVFAAWAWRANQSSDGTDDCMIELLYVDVWSTTRFENSENADKQVTSLWIMKHVGLCCVHTGHARWKADLSQDAIYEIWHNCLVQNKAMCCFL